MYADTSALIVKVLDGLDARYQAVASNIANAATPGYRPLRVDFEAQLLAASERGTAAVMRWTPQTSVSTLEQANGDVRVDLELASAADTAMRYSAMLEVLRRRSQISLTSINGGR